ncbi:hypothetical protein M758_4G177800 [Ceratodon purpureus]|uniref:Uncharacterized protein n=1 Tax=Ceratodon purpureus TaxID=3225 RepID=A0A8T0I9L3_CERPU|nr:hypothetical protein KC19_4G175700 [Ceratodon purpureus]KAG0619953.1 hypothetical protein M758_4G177800 [Ceratodon purpureus]
MYANSEVCTFLTGRKNRMEAQKAATARELIGSVTVLAKYKQDGF